MGPLLIEGNLGKRDVSLDLKSEKDRQTLRQLILDADIALDGYRPSALERLGFGESYLRTLARRRGRGIIVVCENCYGWHGPLASRACWQQISDCFTGVAWGMGEFLGLEEPIVPLLPNSDYQTGIAEVQASLHALHPDFAPRRSDDMGALMAKYLRTAYANTPALSKPEYFEEKESNYGRSDGKLEMLRFVTSPAKLDVTALGYDIGICFHGAYAPEWPARSA
ncbi:hypothetical protein COCVIDRAFT_15968 [Bipolaris victoriae FI3]|uniref:Uncharacterized protein n=1 Tax=Bipolaris victoriae (strain FI3) TaxID=930091 RepID=W7EMB8_BIPV3|nr:hypothetical protein COCVIDRAFT_15968 [Bipolaris victoriae FI3]